MEIYATVTLTHALVCHMIVLLQLVNGITVSSFQKNSKLKFHMTISMEIYAILTFTYALVWHVILLQLVFGENSKN